KDCGGPFIGDHQMTYRGCFSWIANLVNSMLVRGMGIRDLRVVLKISITKVLKTHKSTTYEIKPVFSHYNCLEIDELWTYVGKKKNNVRLIYAYHRESGEIVA
ncbi:MAG: IS1 family transposase, partial [Treponema sp.]|nr:IS1 family transposase [Treponema sp.]